MNDITHILDRVQQGDVAAAGELLPPVTRSSPPLSFTKRGCAWAAATLRILIERARRRMAAKRGAGVAMVDLDEIEILSPVADDG